MGLADRLAFILVIEGLGAQYARIGLKTLLGRNDRLAAAVYAAAGARHYLDEGVIGGAVLDLVHHLGRRAGGVGDSYLHGSLADHDGGFLYALYAAHGGEVDVLKGGAGNGFVSGAQSGLHNAAGGAEYNASAGGIAQHLVEVAVGQLREVDADFLYHAGQLAGGDDDIHIRHAVMTQLGAGGLELLGHAGHDRYGHDVLGIDAVLLGEVALDDRAQHLVRGLAAGQVGQALRIELLAELYPARRTGGYHRQRAAVLDAVNQLVGLFHDGEVRAEVGVEHLVKAQTPEGGGHLAGHGGAHRHAELLAQRRAHGRSGLHDHELLRIVQGVPYLGGVVLLGQSAAGANVNALAAVDAAGSAQRVIPGGGDNAVEAAMHHAYRADVLHLVADGDAAAAQYALGGVAYQRGRGIVDLVVGAGAGEGFFVVNAVFKAHRLQLAGGGAHAREALAVVVAQQQLQVHLARGAHGGGIGLDLHVRGHGQHARGLERARSGINHAHAAGADFVYVLKIAQRRYADARLPGGFQHCRAGRYFHLDAIYRQANQIHVIASSLCEHGAGE